MAHAEQFDAIILGSGQAGGPLAAALAAAGRHTALIESTHVGGTCINDGCTPTKTMVASARVAYLARRSADYGVQSGPVSVDMRKVHARKQAIVDSWRDSAQQRHEKTEHLELIFGEGKFTGGKTIEVALRAGGSRTLQAEQIFINVGARSARPGLPGLDSVPTLDSTSIMDLEVLPTHLLVLGGGYIGLEFAQMFRRFGSEVTLVQKGDQLVGREDPDVAEAVAEILREDGVQVLLNAEAQSVGSGPDDQIQLFVGTASGPRTLTGSHLLVATGRVPNTDRLSLSAAGIEADERGLIKVNPRLETNVAGVYALGDVKPGPAFTHISYDDYRIVKANLIDGGSRTTEGRPIPYTVFIDPQLGRVGLSETEARAQGKRIRVAKMPMSHVARALETDEPRGLMKVVADADDDQILGCAMLGIEGGELMSMIEIAMMGKVGWPALKDGIFAHPNLSESLNNLFGSWTD